MNIHQNRTGGQPTTWEAVRSLHRIEQPPALCRAEAAPTEKPETASVAFTILSGSSPLTKTYGVGQDGAPKKVRSAGIPAKAVADRIDLSGTAGEIAKGFASCLSMLNEWQAIVLAPPPGGRKSCDIVASREVGARTDVFAKTKANFSAPSGVSLIGLDFDTKEWPREIIDRIAAYPGQLTGALQSAFPALGAASFVMRASVSVGIKVSDTGKTTGKNSGQHRYYITTSGADIEAFTKRLRDRLVLAGWGFPFIAATGGVFVRTLIDEAATQDTSRLWYEADAVLADERLQRDARARDPAVKNTGGDFLDTSLLPPLSGAECDRLQEIEAKIVANAQADAAPIRAKWKAKRRQELIAKGVPAERAERLVGAAAEKRELIGDFTILLDDGTAATVNEILDDRARFHGATCPDPLEPEYGGGRNLAIIYTDGEPHIYSHAHGGVDYRLMKNWHEQVPDDSAPPVEPVEPAEAADGAPAQAQSVPSPAAEWPEPIDLFGENDPADLSAPPPGSLPDIIAAWARTEARRKGVSEAFAAASAIAVAAAAVGSSLQIQVRQHDEGWTEPASLWVGLVAEPGRGKSPIVSAAVEPLRVLDRERYSRDKPRHDAWAAASQARRKKPTAPDPGPEPTIRRVVVDDVTLEQQVRIHAANPRGLLRAPDELLAFLGGFGAYKQKADGDRTQSLKFFDGKDVIVDRVGAGSIRAEHALMGLIAGTQPEKIAKLTRDLGADGMLQRFLFVLDDGTDRGDGIDERRDDAATSAYSRAVRALAVAEYRFPLPLQMSPEAHRVLKEPKSAMSRLKAIPGMPSAWRGHVEKWGKFLPRLVLVFHALEEIAEHGSVDPAKPIEATTARKAVDFARFLLRHSLRFYQTFFDPDQKASESRAVAGFLLTRPELEVLTHRTIYDARKSLREDRRFRLSVMAELEAAGWCRVMDRDENGPRNWHVNPLVHARFHDHAKREKAERERRRNAIVEAGCARKWLNEDRMS